MNINSLWGELLVMLCWLSLMALLLCCAGRMNLALWGRKPAANHQTPGAKRARIHLIKEKKPTRQIAELPTGGKENEDHYRRIG